MAFCVINTLYVDRKQTKVIFQHKVKMTKFCSSIDNTVVAATSSF